MMSAHLYKKAKELILKGHNEVTSSYICTRYAVKWGEPINKRVIHGPDVFNSESISDFLNYSPFLMVNFDPNRIIGKVDWIRCDSKGLLCNISITDEEFIKYHGIIKGGDFWRFWCLVMGGILNKVHQEGDLMVVENMDLTEISLVPNICDSFDRNKSFSSEEMQKSFNNVNSVIKNNIFEDCKIKSQILEVRKEVNEEPTRHDQPYKLVTREGEYVGTQYGPDRGPAIPTRLVEAGRVFVRKEGTFLYVEDAKGDVKEAWRSELMSVKIGGDHGNLAGLTDDEHTQYCYLQGYGSGSGFGNFSKIPLSDIGPITGVQLS